MIDYLIAAAVQPGMTILLPWPDWAWRPFLVLRVQRTPVKVPKYVLLDIRAREGEDVALVHQVARKLQEPVHVVTKQRQRHPNAR